MRIRFEYPVKTALRLKEDWPVKVAGVTLEWRMNDDQPVALVATFPTTEKDKLPSIKQSVDQKVPVHLNLGSIDRHDEVEQIVRSFHGLLSLFVAIDVDFDHYKTSWQPDTDEERSQLQLHSFAMNREQADIWAARPLSYELVARAMSSSEKLAAREVTLAFLRRGSRAFYAGDFVQAFYNFFFFLETQFAGGYSDQKKVVAALIQAEPLKQALHRIRSGEDAVAFRDGVRELLKRSDEDLIKHLVKMRGDLHHHALRRKDAWHPDKPRAVESEADILQQIVHSIAFKESMASMFEDEISSKLRSDAEAAGAIVRVKVVGHGIRDGARVSVQPTVVTAPGRIVDRPKLRWIFAQLRMKNRYNDNRTELAELTVRSEDEREIFSRWRRSERPPKAPDGDQIDRSQDVPRIVGVDIWFVCTIELRPEFTATKGMISQEHGRATRIRVPNVPTTQVIDGLPSGRVLESAEVEFLRLCDDLYPDHDIIVWETRLNAANGQILSRYETYV